MTQNVNVPLPEETYQRLKRWAESRQQDIGEAIADYLSGALTNGKIPVVPPAQPDPELEREKAAYLKLYPHLKEQYAGHYVAIYGGQMIDHDEDYGALFERVDDRYPHEFVWLTQVEEEPIKTIVFRSPRFVKDTP